MYSFFRIKCANVNIVVYGNLMVESNLTCQGGTSEVYLHPDNYLHKVDALSCQGGERMGRSSFSPPPKK